MTGGFDGWQDTPLKQQFEQKVGDDALRDHQQTLLVRDGVLDLDQVSRILSNAVGAADREQSPQHKKRAQAQRDMIYHLVLDELDRQREWLTANIDKHRAYFEELYGADWRQTLAQDILDGDEYPQRRAGESVDDYNRRIEDAIFTKIIGPDGRLNPEYRDHPEAARLQAWADDRRALDAVESRRTAIERALTPEAKQHAVHDAVADRSIYEIAQIRASAVEQGFNSEAKRLIDFAYDQSDHRIGITQSGVSAERNF